MRQATDDQRPAVFDPEEGERGAALIMAFFFVVMLAGFSILILNSYQAQSSNTIFRVRHAQAFAAADLGIARGKLILTSNPNAYANANNAALGAQGVDGVQTLTVTELNGTGSDPYLFQVTSVGTDGNGNTRTIEIILQLEQTSNPVSAPGMGAIVANGNVRLLGNIQIDGNDHDAAGNLGGGGEDKPGIVTTGSVDIQGSPNIGGQGIQLTDGASGSLAQGTNVDQGTSIWDKEGTGTGGTGDINHDDDGVDNDGDGVADENGFPTRPGEVFGFTDETELKAKASADGTLFTSISDYEDWIDNTSAVQRGGKIIYLELPNNVDYGQFDLPNNPPSSGAKPSIFIVAGQDPLAHDVTIGPVHIPGHFQGFVVADTYDKVNGNGMVTGSLLSFNPSNVSKFGNGNPKLLYSSEVIGGLPGVTGGSVPWNPVVLSWREVVD